MGKLGLFLPQEKGITDRTKLPADYTESPIGTCALALAPHCRFVEMLLTWRNVGLSR